MENKIYKITCTADEMFYIGRTNKSLCTRLKEHLAQLESDKHNKKFQNCYNKHGPESFIIELLEAVHQSTASTLEEKYIASFWGNSKLLNCSKHGSGGHTTAGYTEAQKAEYLAKRKGWTHTESAKSKISVALAGNKHWEGKLHSTETRLKMLETRQNMSLETRAKISESNKGRVVSAETRDKISKAQIGKVIPKESRLKMAKAATGRVATVEARAKSKTRGNHPRFINRDFIMYHLWAQQISGLTQKDYCKLKSFMVACFRQWRVAAKKGAL